MLKNPQIYNDDDEPMLTEHEARSLAGRYRHFVRGKKAKDTGLHAFWSTGTFQRWGQLRREVLDIEDEVWTAYAKSLRAHRDLLADRLEPFVIETQRLSAYITTRRE